ncbi:hypothetical protein CN184_28400 [Sinorhizobium medicae]|uniref:hypothetical protein n=1 Tax=Sinorhizobium medicae TaxID=110321 RepID=UPI000FD58F39|nr:hypothetical protein [Sinorhizobium medicae]RVJ16514.1 hypothetical protein CN184_28400 [Sinorhizobium medicae]
MEDEAIISDTETAIGNEQDAASLMAAYLDMEDASDNSSEQADTNVEQLVEDENDATETPSEAEDPIFEIDGEQLPLSEVRNRMMMRAEFTRKTQELAEQRKVYQEAQFDKNQLRMEALQGIEALKQQMAIEFRQLEQPDWDYLVENDPAEFQRQQFIWGKREAAVRQMYEAEQALRQQADAYEKEQHQIALQESQQRLLEKYPELRDRAKATEALAGMSELLASYEYTQEDVSDLSDHRAISMIYDLYKLVKAQQSIPEVVAKMEQKPVISQKNTSAKTSDAYTRDYNKFNKSRNGKDAIALISRLL